MRNRLRSAAVILVAAVFAVSGLGAWSEPARTIKIIDPFPPGAPEYLAARLLGDQIARAHGPSFVIENRPGAGSAIGTEAASRAEPDGSTLLIASPAIVINSQLHKLNYDPLTSFEPICLLVNSPNIIAVNSASPYQTLADLFDAARAKPGDLTLAGVGPATSAHIAIEMLKRAANLNMTFIPYPGAPPAVNALLGEHVTAFFGSYPNVAMNLSAGKLRALATASRTRIDLLPDVPTIAEFWIQGLRGKPLVRIVCAREDAKGYGVPTGRMVWCCTAGRRGQGKACCAGAVSSWNLRRGF